MNLSPGPTNSPSHTLQIKENLENAYTAHQGAAQWAGKRIAEMTEDRDNPAKPGDEIRGRAAQAVLGSVKYDDRDTISQRGTGKNDWRRYWTNVPTNWAEIVQELIDREQKVFDSRLEQAVETRKILDGIRARLAS